MSGFTLVVLAAGMGSRYGGLKQLDPVGPGGAVLMDYSVFDAVRAGCTSVVFVIRPEMETDFRAFAAERYARTTRVRTVHQRNDDVPAGHSGEGRTKPWGTGHALLAVAQAVAGVFVVVNADDFYGRAAFAAAAAFCGEAGGSPPAWAVVGYRLRDTVSSSGGVNRAVCLATGGWLGAIEEVRDIVATSAGSFRGEGPHGPAILQGDALVSMNMWVFTPELGALLRGGFERFLAEPGAAAGEYLLPTAVENVVRTGAARVRVLDPGSRWFGMTYPSDRPAVAAALGQLVRDGVYPDPLWPA